MADTFDVVVQVYDDVSGELKGDANVKTSAGMTYFSDGESLQEKVDSGEFTSGEQGPEGPPGPNSADLISVVDTEGLLGTPGTVVMSQNLFDAIVDSVANKLLPYARLANNGLTTEEGFALDARYGKTLKELFDSVNSNLSGKASASDLEIKSLTNNINSVSSLWSMTPNASLCTVAGGYPQDNVPGWLETLYSNSTTVLQRYTGTDNKTWQRFKFSGQWSSWIQL